MEIQRGQVAERPFARLVYNTALQRFTGDLILVDGGAEYRTSWEDGRVVAATSAATTDSLARVALNAGLATSTLLGRFLDEVKRQPKRDELEIFGELARLHPQQQVTLKRRLLGQRATRQFGLPNATFVLNNARSMSADPQVPPIDPRWLIFQGVRGHYQSQRLEREMSPVFGHRFRLDPSHANSIDAFGFNPTELAAVKRLENPMSAEELVVACGDLDRPSVLAIFYVLAATNHLDQAGAAPSARNPLTQPAARTISNAEIEAMRRARAQPHARSQPRSAVAPPTARTVPRATPASSPRPPRPTAQGTERPSPSVSAAAPTTSTSTAMTSTAKRRRRRSTAAATNSRWQKVSTNVSAQQVKLRPSDVRKLIVEKAGLVDSGADHFRVIGVPFNANERQIRRGYFDLAKKLHPDRMQALGIDDELADAQRVFAAINLAFAVLSDRRKLAEYRMSLESNLGAASGGGDDDIEAVAAAIFGAEEAFRLGEMALRRNHLSDAIENFTKAVELNPDEGEHHAFLAWSVFCEAHDKRSVIGRVQEGMAKATEISPNNPMPYLLRAHVARSVGDAGRAERYYRKVLALDPQNSDAQMQLRLLKG